MSDIKFESNLPEAKRKLNAAAVAGMNAAVLTIERYVKFYSRKDTGATRDSYSHEVKEKGNEVIGAVGSDMMNGIYEEFGTGEHAEKGDGRKGWWVYVKGEGGGKRSSSGGKTYTYEEAARVVAMMRKKGLDAHMTRGKKPNKPLRRGMRVAKQEVQDILGKNYTMEFGGR